MNLTEYERGGAALYAEFAEVVRSITEKALAATAGVPHPQALQCRGKDVGSLRAKLEGRGLLESASIETELRDLAGVRLIFYTNLDVERFLSSRLIFATFQIEPQGVRIHHPTAENARTRYQAFHYTVTLGSARAALPEYAKFAGMRCEIQIQTILNHAWSETAHDMIYKPQRSKGFGERAFKSIEARMMKVMDDHLMQAGYEIQKVQADFERLMQGKDLFDRGTLETLAKAANNNDRHEILSTIRDVVIPNYDDIAGVFPELLRSIMTAAGVARRAPVVAIKTPFGNLKGQTADDVIEVVIGILDDLRYLDVAGIFQALSMLYKESPSDQTKERVLGLVRKLASHDLDVWKRFGPAAELTLIEAVVKVPATDYANLAPLLLAVWRGMLDTEVEGTSWNMDAVTISSGALPVSDALRKIRDTAIAALFALFDNPNLSSHRWEIVSAMVEGTRLPNHVAYSAKLCALVLDDSKRIIDELFRRAPGIPHHLLAHIEHEAFWIHRHTKDIPSHETFKADCAESATALLTSIEQFRDAINGADEFVRFKTLVGYVSIFAPDWEDDEFHIHESDGYRKRKAAEYVDSITEATVAEWGRFIGLCASTKSNDGATFPIFGEFLKMLAERKPELAASIFAKPSDDLLHFICPILVGLHSAGAPEYETLFGERLRAGTHLTGSAHHFSFLDKIDIHRVVALMSRAMEIGDDIAVMECVAVSVKKHDPDLCALVDTVFVPSLRYLTGKANARWINGVWFMQEAGKFVRGLTAEQVAQVLENLRCAPAIEHQAERILRIIAKDHLAAVWELFVHRLRRERDGDNGYEPAPYRFHGLEKELSCDAALALQAIRPLYDLESRRFRFRGGRLLSAVFPNIDAEFLQELSLIAASGQDADLRFVLGILLNYEGQTGLHPLLQQIVELAGDDDPILDQVSISVDSTGVVAGQFGFVEAFRSTKAAVQEWLDDPRPAVAAFARRHIATLDNRIADEQRRAEQDYELRRRNFNDGDEASDQGGD